MEAGVNMSGMEFNAGTIPGRAYWDYGVPSASEFSYYSGKGVKLVRLPVLWERLQPNLFAASPSPAFDTTYLQLIRQVMASAATYKIQVILDVHDYGGYSGAKLGGGVLKITQFANFWHRLAKALKTTPNLAGYDLMNEPEGLPNAGIWPAAAQVAVDAIRTVDAKTPIYIEGDAWASAATWMTYNSGLSIVDPSNKLVYEAHVYGDQDNSGTHFVWSQVAAAGVTVNTIAQRIVPFATWCATEGHSCMIGEVGVGNDDPDWNTELSNGLAAAQAGGMVSFTYWAGGPWWGSYPMSIEPTNGEDAPQMSVVGALAQ